MNEENKEGSNGSGITQDCNKEIKKDVISNKQNLKGW